MSKEFEKEELPEVGDLCWFWNDLMLFPVLGILKGIQDYKSDMGFIVYTAENATIKSERGIDGYETIEVYDFYHCKKFDGSLPKEFKKLLEK